VKELAQETVRASDDISRRVSAIRSETAGGLRAIEEITAVVSRISPCRTTIAAAVVEQTVTSREIRRHVGRASAASQSHRKPARRCYRPGELHS
jgi:methyl-accepting chemotaxis protein